MAETDTTSNPNEQLSLTNDLPLKLLNAQTIPPCPTRSQSTIDYLPDYSTLSWIAYAASSLLVISHFPSPNSKQQSLIGPIYRQVIDISNDDGSSIIKAVSWSPVFPSLGEVAVAVENCICLYSERSRIVNASFGWVKVAVLVQCYIVEAVRWTGCGDGIVSVGVEVVLWKRKNKSWEIAWKFTPEQPQAMVSATWSSSGPVASAGCLNGSVNRFVLVCQSDEKNGLVKSELSHPDPVLMIQWRPSVGVNCRRDVLLTCCLDGTVRLWSEIDSGRAKYSKQSFCVIAVIEINQSLKGTLGADIFITWATEIRDMTDEGGLKWCSTTEGSEYDMRGRCEWLIGYGPSMSLTFWAIHCLDDISPLRFPRVTVWKTLSLAGAENRYLLSPGNLNSEDQFLFIKAVISRSNLHGPPAKCSLFQLLPDNSMGWSQLHTLESSNTQGELLNLGGHTGNILQVAVHPYGSEIELAVSLDSSGFLLFWSLSKVSSCIFGMPAQVLPSWKLAGKLPTKHWSSVEFSCLSWAPSVLKDFSVLLLASAVGIDCIMIEIAENEGEKVVFHKLCTIPFTGHNHVEGPTSIFVIPLPSTCRETFTDNHFMLLGIWMNEFRALSWKVTLHSADASGSSCDCNFDVFDTWKYESSFAVKRYCLVAEPCSSKLCDSHNHDQVTSVAVVSPGILMPSVQQKWSSSDGFSSHSVPYHMATGYSDGTIRLWRSNCSISPTPQSELANLPWELVGSFNTHQGPVTKISLSSCGGKIATISMKNNLDSLGTLCIWRSVCIVNSGKILLEDKLPLSGELVALNWFSIGNGQLLLGVCSQHELRVYAQRSRVTQTLGKSGKKSETHMWYCIATGSTSLVARDFLWGPSAATVLVHERCFCLFSKWLLHMDEKQQAVFYVQCKKDKNPCCMGVTEEGIICDVFSDCNACDTKELSLDGINEKCKSASPLKLNVKSDYPVFNLFSTMSQRQDHSGSKTGLRNILEVAAKLRGSLPTYHPDTLLLNLYSGNWRRACVAVQHLVGYLTNDNTSVEVERAYDSVKPYHIIPQIPLSKYFEEQSSTGVEDKGLLVWGRDTALVSSDSQYQINSIHFNGHHADANGSSNKLNSGSGRSEIRGFIETIEKFNNITALTSMERLQMLAVIDLLDEISDLRHASVYGSLDEPGRRFWVAVRFQQLHLLRRSAATSELVVDSGMIGWAFHSDCQDNLFTSFLSNEPSWEEMRNLGVGFWFTSATQLRTRMEKLARSQYLKNKDPKECALLYIALNRLQVLAGLFRISKAEKDKPLVGFLSRNFQDEKNKAAALKNAYVLMGKHQLELAIAFFLLGGDTSSAVSVCAKNLGDEQLALVICRLIEDNGGPLERHLISKFLLPTAMEKGDCWLASVLEWTLGNYLQSYQRLLGFKMETLMNKSVLTSNQTAFLDPKVGQYCLILAAKTFMKNCIGEPAAAVLTRWATLMTSIALNRCGLPVEALQCLSSSLGTIESKEEGGAYLGVHGISLGILEESNDSSNWLTGDVALCVESNDKLDIALHYISNLVMEHPSWRDLILPCLKPLVSNEGYRSFQYNLSLENFQHTLNAGLATFEQKYLLNPVHLLNMILIYLCNVGMWFLGYHILHGFTSQAYPQDKNHTSDSIFQSSPVPKMILKSTEEISSFCARYLMCCSIIYSPPSPPLPVHNVLGTNRSHQFHLWDVYMKGSIHILNSYRDTVKLYFPSFFAGDCQDLMMEIFTALDILEYYIIFTSAWLQKNVKALVTTVHPMFVAYNNGHTPSKVDIENLKKQLCKNVDLMMCDSLGDKLGEPSDATRKQSQLEQRGDLLVSIPDDERWQILGACLWRHLSDFTRNLLNPFSDSQTNDRFSKTRLSGLSSSIYVNESSESNWKLTVEALKQVPGFFAKFLESTVACVASSHAKQLASVLSLKLEKEGPVPTILWLEKSELSHSITPFLEQEFDSLQLMSNENEASLLRILWEMSVNPVEVRKAFSQENMGWLQSISQKLSKGWTDVHRNVQNLSLVDDQDSSCSSSADGEGGFPGERRSQDNSSSLKSRLKDSTFKEIACFRNPEEIYKRNGELLEGILFFEWKDEKASRDYSKYIWSEVDWPQNGWAGSESTPIPTFVSPGIGLGSKKGAHLGLGGATVGLGSLARSGRNLMGSQAFGIPGYGGIDGSGLGWGTSEDFEFVDPPATVDNISTRALSGHPSRPFFLAGSSNTHIYLWEFGKEKAIATYGVLPAANVPPPYALASIEALQFDNCGHRFVTAASDGTICTWQLEVGGRSNVRPTESSLCFNRHALDVAYVAASGSVIAAAGYCSDDVNVVIWDTLAPTATSQASLICHEGGARSVSVFDSNVGSGSISPLIVTGGKGGDVGLHDFRFIATGKTKRHRHSNSGEQNPKHSSNHETHSGISTKYGEQNSKGMLWYLPKAHTGSVTRIATIPDTSFFLTGSKDGDVKLWDAKKAELVFHWPKLHERHTFLQPSSRGFGGIVRAAVTDIQVLSNGFLTCGGDGTVKMVQIKGFPYT
ncbi:hypothetical protein IFM89_034767 [Coptis chinensis]|uniref:RAVE complex protein Rav1 C-terminal domain-containing protein n=1 Tax=Coptis chinensis TaxID=261450 RepID=A0A835HA73_9MAGN|nr:hypothetical protein IFM89_034767 [Coptis chinensis]